MKRYWIPATLMLLIALVLAGCADQTAAPATSEPAKPSAVPSATEQMAEPTVKVEPTAGPAPPAPATVAGGPHSRQP